MSGRRNGYVETQRGQPEPKDPCDAEDQGSDCGVCQTDWDNRKRPRGQGSTRCTATCTTTRETCKRNARVGTKLCKQHIPFELPNDITWQILRSFMTAKDRARTARVNKEHNTVKVEIELNETVPNALAIRNLLSSGGDPFDRNLQNIILKYLKPVPWVDEGKVEETILVEGHTGQVTTVVKISEDIVVSGSVDKTLRVWNIKTGEEPKVLEGHTGPVYVAIKMSEKIVVSGSGDGTLRVWDINNGKCLHTLKGHTDSVCTVTKISENIVVSGSYDDTLRVWNIETGTCLHTLKGHAGAVNVVTKMSENIIVSGSSDNTLRVWNIKNEENNCIQVLEGHTEPVTSVTKMSENIVVSGSNNKTLRVWNIKTGKYLKVLTGHTGPVYTVIKMSEKIVVSGSRDGTLRVWNINKKKIIASRF